MIKDGKKYCPKCQQEKPVERFAIDNSRKDKLQPYCKDCASQYRKDNKERLAEYHKEYTKEHEEEKREYLRQYHELHKEEQNKKNRERRKGLNFSVSVTEKKCSKCGEIKPAEEFHIDKSKKEGLSSFCKKCSNKENKRRANINKQINVNREFNLTLIKKCYQCGEEKTLNNFFKNNQNKDGFGSLCKSCNYKYQQTEHRKLIRKRSVKKRVESGEMKEWQKQKRKTDPNFKISNLLRGRVRKLLKNKNVMKNNSTLELLGCSFEYFKEYIESQFQPGMNWENQGNGKNKWNLDHIIPCSKFDLTDIEHQKICFHFLNLQPLWFEENMKKSDKIVENVEYLIDAIIEARKQQKVA